MKPKEDWENVKERWAAWWECELYDRILLQVHAPMNKPVPGKNDEPILAQKDNVVTPEIKWSNIDFMINQTMKRINSTFYGGEAIPVFYHGWSIGHALLFGCEPDFKDDTIWTNPIPVQKDGYPFIKADKTNKWYKWFVENTEKAARASGARYYVMPAWGNHAGDNLALIRGSEQLMIDIAENPDWVRKAIKVVSDALIEFREVLWGKVSLTGMEGSMNYVSCWSPGRTLGLDCDVSCMVSPDTFKQIFLPPLIETMEAVDHRIYHLDGPGAIQHLDTLLNLKEIHAIQWVPGAGAPGIMQWIPLIKRIQKKRKAVVVPATPDEIRPLLKEVSPEGLCVSTSCKSEDQARKLIEEVTTP